MRNRESLFHAKFTITVNRESLFHAKIIYFFIRESISQKFCVFFTSRNSLPAKVSPHKVLQLIFEWSALSEKPKCFGIG